MAYIHHTSRDLQTKRKNDQGKSSISKFILLKAYRLPPGATTTPEKKKKKKKKKKSRRTNKKKNQEGG